MKQVDELLEDHLQWVFRNANRMRGYVLLFGLQRICSSSSSSTCLSAHSVSDSRARTTSFTCVIWHLGPDHRVAKKCSVEHFLGHVGPPHKTNQCLDHLLHWWLELTWTHKASMSVKQDMYLAGYRPMSAG
jgi:hypothetical protein